MEYDCSTSHQNYKEIKVRNPQRIWSFAMMWHLIMLLLVLLVVSYVVRLQSALRLRLEFSLGFPQRD